MHDHTSWTSYKYKNSAWRPVPAVNCILLVVVCLVEPKRPQNIDFHVCLANQHVQSYGNFDRRTSLVTSVLKKIKRKGSKLSTDVNSLMQILEENNYSRDIKLENFVTNLRHLQFS